MPYVPTSWVDNTTLVNAARMNNIEGGVSAAEVTANKNQPSGYVGLDASSRIVFQGDATANLYRGGAGFLRTDGYIQAGVANGTGFLSEGNIWVGHAAGSTGAGGGLVFGSAADTNLYRSAANILSSDDQLRAVGLYSMVGATSLALGTYVAGDSYERFRLQGDGQMAWGQGTGSDVVIYRSVPGGLPTLQCTQGFSGNLLAMRYGLDKAVSGATLNVTSGFHRISGYDSPNCTTITGTSIDGALLVLYNISGGAISFNTGSNIMKTFSLANGSTVLLLYNAIQSVWMPLYY